MVQCCASGCGKSHLIHIIKCIVTPYCQGQRSCFCSALPGYTAFRIGGSNVHSFAGVNVTAPWQESSNENRTNMKQKLNYI